MNKPFYITTPIYYPSGEFHIGTAVTTLIGDVLARYHRSLGEDVWYVTGMDEHGQKIAAVAKEKGLLPQDHVDQVAVQAKAVWKELNISYDDFIRTTELRHEALATKVFQKFIDQDDIYLDKYQGYYCLPCESYYTEAQLVDGKCPDCARAVEWMEEEAYFFRMNKYANRLMEYYNDHPDFILPAFRKNEMVKNFLEPGLEDLCVSRSTFDWGIKVPGNEKHVMYVWTDALFNYLSVLGYLSEDETKFNKYWPCNVHLVGKDIIRFHTIYWPIFLMALDLPLPEHVYAHGFYLMKNDKMSKSKGGLIRPGDLIEHYGLDATRYYILAGLPYAQDGHFTPEAFIDRYNYDLCNDLGNLLNRTVGMINKYFAGTVVKSDNDLELDKFVTSQTLLVHKALDNFEISNSLTEIWKIIGRTNKYIEEQEPWTLFKNNDQVKLQMVMYNLVESLRIVANLLKYYLPDTSLSILKQLGLTPDNELVYGKNYETKVIEVGEPLFIRLEKEAELEWFEQIIKN